MKKFVLLLFIPFVSIFGSTLIETLKKSAEQGEAEAQFNLGVMYDFGEGVPQDYKQALYWYKKSAEQGYAKAQFNLGLMYDSGKGVIQDYIEAYAWINVAGANGLDVTKVRSLISKKMTPDQIDKAQARSKVIWAELEAKKK